MSQSGLCLPRGNWSILQNRLSRWKFQRGWWRGHSHPRLIPGYSSRRRSGSECYSPSWRWCFRVRFQPWTRRMHVDCRKNCVWRRLDQIFADLGLKRNHNTIWSVLLQSCCPSPSRSSCSTGPSFHTSRSANLSCFIRGWKLFNVCPIQHLLALWVFLLILLCCTEC